MKKITDNRTAYKIITMMLTLIICFALSVDEAHAAKTPKAPAKVTGVSASSAGDTAVALKWKKNKKGASGYAIYCDGELVARAVGGKKKAYTVTNLDSGTKFTFTVRAYKTYKVKQWLNTKTGKYQTKKPPKNARGKTRKVVKYKYGKHSARVSAKTTGIQPPGRKNANSLSAAVIQNEMLRQINAQRAKVGAKPLVMAPELTNLAEIKVKDMYNYGEFDHYSARLGYVEDQVEAAGINASGCGENIAWGQRNINEAMNSWMNSPGHRENILFTSYTHVAVAYYGGFWVQQFFIEPDLFKCDRCGRVISLYEDWISAEFEYAGYRDYSYLDFCYCMHCKDITARRESEEQFWDDIEAWYDMVSEEDKDNFLNHIKWYNSEWEEIPCPIERVMEDGFQNG